MNVKSYVVRIYRHEPGRVVAGERRDALLTGLVEGVSGHKAAFHDAEALWQFLVQEMSAAEPSESESDG
jgi:hypothetical protein